MSNPRVPAVAGLIFAMLLLILTASDFLALTDIYHDYVSTRVFKDLRIPRPAGLPDWTATSGEWLVVSISVYARILLLAGSVVALALYAKSLGHQAPSTSSESRGGKQDQSTK